MLVEIFTNNTVEVQLNKFLCGRNWEYNILTGDHVEQYYLGETDDVVLEIYQEVWYAGECSQHHIIYIDYTDSYGKPRGFDGKTERDIIRDYIINNPYKVILAKDVEDFF